MVVQGVWESEEVIGSIDNCHSILEVLVNGMVVREMLLFLMSV